MNKNEGEQDFTAEEREAIMACPPKGVKELAAKLGATARSVYSMRMFLLKERKSNGLSKPVKFAAEPQMDYLKAEADGQILIKFGKSSMLINKNEVSVIELSEAGILIAK